MKCVLVGMATPIWAGPKLLWLGFVHDANLKLMESGMMDIGENETEKVVTKQAMTQEGEGDNGYMSISVTSLLVSMQTNHLLE